MVYTIIVSRFILWPKSNEVQIIDKTDNNNKNIFGYPFNELCNWFKARGIMYETKTQKSDNLIKGQIYLGGGGGVKI